MSRTVNDAHSTDFSGKFTSLSPLTKLDFQAWEGCAALVASRLLNLVSASKLNFILYAFYEPRAIDSVLGSIMV